MTGEARRRNVFQRGWAWFWRADAVSELRQASVAASPRARELYRRARLADELGRRVLDNRSRARNPLLVAHAAEHFRQALTWVLHALETANPGSGASASSTTTLELLWSGPSKKTLATALGDPELLTSAEPLVLGGSFVRYAEMGPEQGLASAQSLRQLVRRVLSAVEAPQARLDRAYRRRFLHVGVIAFLAAALFVLATAGQERREASRDLARDRPWKASSHLMGGCQSPAQSCPESPMYFFHTKDDESPFLVIDLGQKKRFSSLRIQNRIECCHDRGLPLLVEVSNDQKKWKQVAKRDDEFDVWRPKFKAENARWVRLRAGSKTWLHLASVRVLP